MNFLEIRTAIKCRLARILKPLNQRPSFGVGIEAEDEINSTLFLQMQKNQLIHWEELFQIYCNTLPVFGFNSAR